MLVPLETLPGWPPAPNPALLVSIGLLIGLPLVIGLVIAGASFVGSSSDIRRFGPPFNPATIHAGPAIATAPAAAIESGDQALSETGGTSARW